MCRGEDCYKNIIAVTNRNLCDRPYMEQIERICSRHPKAVLVREKDLPVDEYARLLAQVQEICLRYGVQCIAHTYTDAAVQCGIDVVHYPLNLLQDEMHHPVSKKKILHIRKKGASVHSVEEALLAEALGADYLTAGHIFETGCKPGAAPRGKDFLRSVCTAVKIPVYAIGGMSASEKCVESMVLCGAAGICVMSECMQW